MRTALVTSLLALTAACSSSPPPPAAPASSTPPPAVASSSAVPQVLAWGGSGTSSGVLIQIATPTASTKPVIGVDGKPDPKFRFVTLPITATNKSTGTATISVTGRVGQQEAGVFEAENGLGKFLPGEGGPFERLVKVPVDASELVLEVYANVNQEPTTGRLQFKGPLPPTA